MDSSSSIHGTVVMNPATQRPLVAGEIGRGIRDAAAKRKLVDRPSTLKPTFGGDDCAAFYAAARTLIGAVAAATAPDSDVNLYDRVTRGWSTTICAPPPNVPQSWCSALQAEVAAIIDYPLSLKYGSDGATITIEP